MFFRTHSSDLKLRMMRTTCSVLIMFEKNFSSYFSLSPGSAASTAVVFSLARMTSVTFGNRSTSRSPQYWGCRRLYVRAMAFLQSSIDGGGSAGPVVGPFSLGFVDGRGYLSLSCA